MNVNFKIFFYIILLFCFNTLLFAFESGSGTAGDPYRISTAAHLNDVRNFLTSHFIVVNDINLNEAPYNTGSGWDPIGTSGSKFQGTFDGNNKIISNLFPRSALVNKYRGSFIGSPQWFSLLPSMVKAAMYPASFALIMRSSS